MWPIDSCLADWKKNIMNWDIPIKWCILNKTCLIGATKLPLKLIIVSATKTGQNTAKILQ